PCAAVRRLPTQVPLLPPPGKLVLHALARPPQSASLLQVAHALPAHHPSVPCTPTDRTRHSCCWVSTASVHHTSSSLPMTPVPVPGPTTCESWNGYVPVLGVKPTVTGFEKAAPSRAWLSCVPVYCVAEKCHEPSGVKTLSIRLLHVSTLFVSRQA